MESLNALIGSVLIIISKRKIRYEGILHDIDAAHAAVALRDVKCFGTENRVHAESEIVLGDDKVHPFVVFHGPDISDLQILKPSPQRVYSNPLSVDPAVVTVQSSPPDYPKNQNTQVQVPQPKPQGVQQFSQPVQQSTSQNQRQQQELQQVQNPPQQNLEQQTKQQISKQAQHQESKYKEQQGQLKVSPPENKLDNEKTRTQEFEDEFDEHNQRHQSEFQPKQNQFQQQKFQHNNRRPQYRKKEPTNDVEHQSNVQTSQIEKPQQVVQNIPAFPGSGNHLLTCRAMNQQVTQEQQLQANFDFETSMKDFEKVVAEVNLHKTEKTTFHYDGNDANHDDNDATPQINNGKKKMKDSFFDDFSVDDQASHEKYLTRNEKQLNIETFGAAGLQTYDSNRGRRPRGNSNRNGPYVDSYHHENDDNQGHYFRRGGRGRGRGNRGRGGRGRWLKQHDDERRHYTRFNDDDNNNTDNYNKNKNHSYDNPKRSSNDDRYRQTKNNNINSSY
jgi:protein LSM14